MEQVVLLDESGAAIGAAPKAAVHSGDTPLHLAFSCYLFTDAGELLLTQRALTKSTFPAVWTNTVCGHPAPGEPLEDAARRRALAELGLEVGAVRVVLPQFRYRAQMNGVVEHEMCPVLVGELPGGAGLPGRAGLPGGIGLSLDPFEVEATAWAPWRQFRDEVLAQARAVSPWCRLQVRDLAELGDDPAGWAVADPGLLPPAARAVA